MSTMSAVVNVRIDAELKEQAAAVLAEYGMTVSDAARIILTRIAKEGGVPPFLLASKEQYDTWFREKVREAMDDPRPGIPHEQVMAEIRANLARKTNAQVAEESDEA